MTSLADTPLADGQVGLLDGLATTRAIRRYTGEPIPEQALRDMLFAATLLHHNVSELVTCDLKGFESIEGLTLLDPRRH